MSVKDKYKEMRKNMKDAQKAMTETAREYFKEGSQEIFSKHPCVDSFSFTCYTPYFNDGDACIFGANIDYPEVNGEVVCSRDEEYLRKANEAIVEFLGNFDDEQYRMMFGDHVKIKVTPKRVTTSEYEHD